MIYERTDKLIGEEKRKILEGAKIAIFGLGGVGGTCFQALLRSGVSKFYLRDADVVNESNLNRQILYTNDDLGQKKLSSAVNLAKKINENVEIVGNDTMLTMHEDLEFLKEYDFVIDCIDSMYSKTHLIKYCVDNNIKLITSLGMGNKLDPTKVEIVTLNQTKIDRLGRKLRKELRKKDVDCTKIMCVYSKEFAHVTNEEITSMIFVPSAAGLALAYYVVNSLINKEE